MFCTTECWYCEDKNCEHYKSKLDLYFENTKLKKELEILTFNFQSLSSACGFLAEFMGLDKDSTIDEMIHHLSKLKKED